MIKQTVLSLMCLASFSACQAFGIKNTDTIEQVEIKAIHVIEEKAGIEVEKEEPISVRDVACIYPRTPKSEDMSL